MGISVPSYLCWRGAASRFPLADDDASSSDEMLPIEGNFDGVESKEEKIGCHRAIATR
jgi:hypothetical protein